ncbi:hypothetical protein [Mucilaginibacter dorajii]|uniref:Transcriptional regulator n=1 Tax=Mucilaginibacter dorajii TaxID=692994 RepID=A0ABP7PEY7_9SPHI|nr:hypothetical protein [Mucilaginibacter dorajii]MCS3735343.1 hypothetical protein [Mucilaginibacter dorajii]
MNTADQDFLEEYKPLHVPHEYDAGACAQNNVVFALAHLEEATADEVARKLSSLEPGTSPATHQKNADDILNYLFDKGLIKANNKGGKLVFNLNKIREANSGKADEL